MRVDLFDYELPPELIAQEPPAAREQARLMVLDRASGAITHRQFHQIVEVLRPGDALVLNETRVLPARLRGRRRRTGGRWEGLFLGEKKGLWEMLTKTRGHPEAGETIDLEVAGATIELVEKTHEGSWLVRPPTDRPATEWLEQFGHVPLPPYIRHGHDAPADRERYQTVFARAGRSVAAPTAGLHFTEAILEQVRAKGIATEFVTLEVGRGTFEPVKTQTTEEHRLHAEWCRLPAQVAQRLEQARRSGGRIVAVGTTVARTLETACQRTGAIEPFEGSTGLFIVPPFTFRAIDALLTNFHVPKSSLLMLVSAFAGRERVLAAYREAVRMRYRFFSYGDAMLIV